MDALLKFWVILEGEPMEVHTETKTYIINCRFYGAKINFTGQ